MRMPCAVLKRCRWPALLLAALHLASCSVNAEGFEDDECKLHTGEQGICRLASNCAWLRPALRAHEITHKQLVNCGFDREEPIICCRTTDAPSIKAERVGVRPAVKACSMYDGKRSQLSYHIIGGSEADSGDVPFIGALGYKGQDTEAYKWACGSSLITPLFLVTAAHCIATIHGDPVVVRMGTLNLMAPVDPDEVQDRPIKKIIVHPKYKTSQKYDDIALLEVESPFQFDAVVQPTCLHTEDTDLDASTTLYAAGWGVTEEQSHSNALLRTNLTTVSVAECTKGYTMFKSRVKDGIRSSQYCARGFQLLDQGRPIHSDTCEGDSGGPLYYETGGDVASKYYLVGVTSFGAGCGSSNPSVYSRISHYLDWIESHVWPSDAQDADDGA